MIQLFWAVACALEILKDPQMILTHLEASDLHGFKYMC